MKISTSVAAESDDAAELLRVQAVEPGSLGSDSASATSLQCDLVLLAY